MWVDFSLRKYNAFPISPPCTHATVISMIRAFLLLAALCFLFPPTAVHAQTHNTIDMLPHATSTKVVALTFDADMTPGMLKRLREGKVASWYNKKVIDVLEAEHVPATLFLTGMWIEQYATTTRELSLDPLFELGNHSYSHGGFTQRCYGLSPVPESHDVSELTKTDVLLRTYAVRYVHLFRFPGLCHDKDDVTAIHTQGYTIVDGNVHGDDGFQHDVGKIVRNVIDHVTPGSIVVLHLQGGPNAPETAVALPLIIEQLRAEGYTFVKVSDMLSSGN